MWKLCSVAGILLYESSYSFSTSSRLILPSNSSLAGVDTEGTSWYPISRARMSSERAAVDAAKAADTAMRTESLFIYSSPLLVYDGIVAVWEGVFMLPFLLPPNVGVTRWPPGYSVHGKKKPVNEARCWLQLHRYSAARPARAAGAAFRASWPRSRPLARIPRDFHTALRPKDAGRRRPGGQPLSPE